MKRRRPWLIAPKVSAEILGQESLIVKDSEDVHLHVGPHEGDAMGGKGWTVVVDMCSDVEGGVGEDSSQEFHVGRDVGSDDAPASPSQSAPASLLVTCFISLRFVLMIVIYSYHTRVMTRLAKGPLCLKLPSRCIDSFARSSSWSRFVERIVEDHSQIDFFGECVPPCWSRVALRSDVETLEVMYKGLKKNRTISVPTLISWFTVLHMIHRRAPISTAAALLLEGKSVDAAVEEICNRFSNN